MRNVLGDFWLQRILVMITGLAAIISLLVLHPLPMISFYVYTSLSITAWVAIWVVFLPELLRK